MKKALFILPIILLVSVFIFGGCAKPLNLVPPPTGTDLLNKAFGESGGQTVDLVVDQEVRDVTVDMFNWWMAQGNIAPYYRLWWPQMHYDCQFVTPPGGGQMNVILKEMIWPYYTEFRCLIIMTPPSGGLAFLAPDGTKIGQLIHTPTASSKGISLHSVFTFPAKTPQSFIDAMRAHCNYEMQDFTRFLPKLYKQKTGNAEPTSDMVPPPTGNEVLMKAFEGSAGQTVDLVVDQEVRDVTVDMFNWWMGGAIAPYYRLWWPEMHHDVQLVTPPGGQMNVILKEMIWPYYTEFRCLIIPPSGLAFLAPDGTKIGQLIHTPTTSSKGISLHSVFTFPAKTPQSFIDAMRAHCNYEMQDFTRFLPELYKQKAGK
jgi:hypothetical protein